MAKISNHHVLTAFSAAIFAILFVLLSSVNAITPSLAQTRAPGVEIPAPSTGEQAVTVPTRPKINVEDAVNTVRDLIKKNTKKPVDQAPTETKTSPTPEIKTTPVSTATQSTVTTGPVKTDSVITPKVTIDRPKPRVGPKFATPDPVIKADTVRVDAPVATPVVAAVVPVEPATEAVIEEISAVPVSPPSAEPAATIAAPASCEATDCSGQSGWSAYAMLAAIVAALAAAGLAAKMLLKPKLAVDCNLGNGETRLTSELNIEPPEISFNVTVPDASSSSMGALAIIA